MKRTFLGFLMACLFISSFAGPVGKEEAKTLAENFYAAQTSSTGTNIEATEVYTATYEGNATFYIFSFSGGGFVLLSADDLAYPVIGYSLTDPVKENIDNPAILKRFEWYSKQVYQAKRSENKNSVIDKAWDNLRKGAVLKNQASGEPLLTTYWDQSPYYNELCPDNTPVGCVATAMAQIMNFHEWPVSGNLWHKYIPSIHPAYGVQYANFSETTYDWANMPNFLDDESSSEETAAVATLMYHAGISVNMDYDAEGSGASSQDVMFALTSYFKYDPETINMFVFDANTDSLWWLNKIKTEIDALRPVYYSGSSEADGGHAFVCDGYDNSGYFHINWGWSGYYNGYFLATAMMPGDFDFSEYNSIITGIKPGAADQGMLWTKQASGFNATSRGILSIAAVSNRVAWAVAYDGSTSEALVRDYTRTVDGGTIWKSGTINATGISYCESSMITAVNDSTAWVALYNSSVGGGKIVKTSDGGTTWNIQSSASFTAPDGFPNLVHFWDINNGFCAGDPNGGYFEIYTTTNGGNTWSRVSEGNIPENLTDEYGVIGYYCVYNDIVWFSTNKGRLFKSTNKGNTWTVYQTPINESFELTFKNELTGVMQSRGEGETTSWRSINGGETWTQITPVGNFYSVDLVYMPGTDTLISTGSDYTTPFMGVSYSTDNGSTFTDYADFYRNYQFLSIGASPEGSVWAGGFNSSRYSDGMWYKGRIGISGDFKINKYTAEVGDSTIVLTDCSYGSPETWEWNFGSGALPQTITGTGPHTIKYTSAGDKTIVLTISKGDEEQIIVKKNIISITGPTGINDNLNIKQYILYPNPAKTIVKLSGFEGGIITIYNSAGSLVLQSKEVLSDNSIDISSLSPGTYIVRILTTDGIALSKKLIVQY